MRLNNKNIVVTAAAQGIGRATAIAYSKEGANVVATDINEEKLNELKAENSNIKTEVLDSTNKEAVENFSKSIKDVDVLFHAVGFVHHGTILESFQLFHRFKQIIQFTGGVGKKILGEQVPT